MMNFLNNLFPVMLGGRSGGWGRVRKEWILEHPLCCGCGRKGTFLKPNEVHHIEDFCHHPEKELDKNNFVTFCRRCHQLLGHHDNFKLINPNVVEDAKWLLEKLF